MEDLSSSSGFEPLINLNEAAKLLGIHSKTLEVMARNGTVPGIKLGKRWRFRASALDEWLKRHLDSEHNHAVLAGKGQHP